MFGRSIDSEIILDMNIRSAVTQRRLALICLSNKGSSNSQYSGIYSSERIARDFSADSIPPMRMALGDDRMVEVFFSTQ